MRRFFPFAALLGAAFVLGCQDVGTGVVGPDGLEPQFARKGKGKPPSGDVGATVTLGNGMTTEGDDLLLVGKYDDTTVTISTNNTFTSTITINFAGPLVCPVLTGEDGSHDRDLEPHVMDYLMAQLEMLEGVTGGSFFLEIDRSGLELTSPQAGNYLLLDGYEGELNEGELGTNTVSTSVRFGWVGPATVEWLATSISGDVFKFTGPIVVAANGVGGRNGKRGRRAIACAAHDDNYVTVTVERV